MEEYTREFEELLLKCDFREDETQTLVRYLSGLDEHIAYIIELHPYSSLDTLSSLLTKCNNKGSPRERVPFPNHTLSLTLLKEPQTHSHDLKATKTLV